jgi:hypothetical protein
VGERKNPTFLITRGKNIKITNMVGGGGEIAESTVGSKIFYRLNIKRRMVQLKIKGIESRDEYFCKAFLFLSRRKNQCSKF